MATFRIDLLDVGNSGLVEASVALLVRAFTNSERYGAERLDEELRASSELFYRRFFVATEARDVALFVINALAPAAFVCKESVAPITGIA